VFRFKDHIKRLEESARIMGSEARVPERDLISVLRVAIKEQTGIELRIRLTLIHTTKPAIFFIALSPFLPPGDGEYKNGVSVTTFELKRHNPAAKNTDFINQSERYRSRVGGDIHEMIMVDENGYLLEGLTSNFYGVMNGKIHTAGKGVLPGITQKIILEESKKLKLRVFLHPIHEKEIIKLTEAFISSSGRAILPVVTINQTIIGKGIPGQVSQTLLSAYNKRLATELFDLFEGPQGHSVRKAN
jgi:branched-chain amino acid aminotransferase